MNELVVSKRLETLLYRIYPALKNFPNSEKFCLCENIKQEFFNALKYVQLANSVKSKRVVYLQEADGHCRVIQILIKLSKEQKYINNIPTGILYLLCKKYIISRNKPVYRNLVQHITNKHDYIKLNNKGRLEIICQQTL